MIAARKGTIAAAAVAVSLATSGCRSIVPTSDINGTAAVAASPRVMRDCPAVPGHVRDAADRRTVAPSTPDEGRSLAGAAVIGEADKSRALADLLTLYDRCRSAR